MVYAAELYMHDLDKKVRNRTTEKDAMGENMICPKCGGELKKSEV